MCVDKLCVCEEVCVCVDHLNRCKTSFRYSDAMVLSWF